MQIEARLRAFAAVARAGSFSGAARELFVSQPSVSKHVAALEAEVGRPLLVRDRRGVVLTPAGEVLADYVLRAEALLATARRALAAGADEETGRVAVAASGTPGTYLLPELVGRLHEQYPGIDVDLRVETSARALDLVRTHAAELAVVGGLVVPPELDAEPLVEDDVVLIGPASLGGRRLAPKQLQGLTWISREEGSATRAAVEAARWQLGLHEVRRLELPTWEAVKLVVAGGGGIAAISRFALDLELEAGVLAVLDVPRWRLTRTISAVTARDVPLTPPAQRFIRLLQETFATREGPAQPENTNLQLPPTRLVGRTDELAELRGLLARADTQLVTIAGSGGAGKTRLAIEAAAALAPSYDGGVYFVDLSSVVEPELVLPTIASTLGAPAAKLSERLGEERILLILDNFEQVVEAAGDVASLVAGSPTVVLLVTSRISLRLRGERVLRLSPLDAHESVSLFVERARAVEPRFRRDAAVEELCARLDGLPLAIELVAARVSELPPRLLLDRLDPILPVLTGVRDAPERQRTLDAAVGWSYELLDEGEQQVFRRLAVFAGGFTAAAASEVVGVAADALAGLVDQSLVRRTDERYSILVTIREFARARLDATDEAGELRRRHAEWVLRLAREARGHARTAAEVEWLSRLTLEHDNIRAALTFLVDAGEPEGALEIVETLEMHWMRGARQEEALRWLEQLLEAPGDPRPEVLAGALAVAGRAAVELGDLERARDWHTSSLELSRTIGDDRRTAWALHGLGHVAMEGEELDEAQARFEESAALFLRIGDHAPAGGRFTFLAEVAARRGDHAAGTRYSERALEQFSLAGDQSGIAAATHGLGDFALLQGRIDAAADAYATALRLMGEIGQQDELLGAYVLGGSAAVLAKRGLAREAAVAWGAGRTIDEQLKVRMYAKDVAEYERRLGELAAADVAAGRALGADEAFELTLRALDASRQEPRSLRSRTPAGDSPRPG